MTLQRSAEMGGRAMLYAGLIPPLWAAGVALLGLSKILENMEIGHNGNLSHQIEHHLFPDIPAYRYAETAGMVEPLCRKYGVPYTTGSFARPVGSVAKRLVRLALPPAAAARRQPGGKRSSKLGNPDPPRR